MQKLWAKKLQLFDTKSPHELGSSGAAQKNCHRRPCVPEHKRAQQTVWDWRDRPNANKMIRSNEQCSLHLYVDPASSIFCIELLKRFTWLQKYLWLILQTVLMVLGTWSEHRRIFWKFKSLEFESAWCWNKINQNRNNHHGTSAPLTRLARRSLGQNRHDESPHMPHCLPQSAKGTKAQHGLLWTRQCNWSPKTHHTLQSKGHMSGLTFHKSLATDQAFSSQVRIWKYKKHISKREVNCRAKKHTKQCDKD